MGVQNIQQLEDSYGFIVLYFIHNYTHQWRTQGGVSGVQTPPPRNSEDPPKNRVKRNQIVKTVKKIC